MTTTFAKTAFAAIFAFAASTGLAFAGENAHAADNSAVLENIYAHMDENRANAFAVVLASAEDRMAERLAKIDNANAPKAADRFVLAAN
jgi:cyanophycinase-like exopeptidase